MTKDKEEPAGIIDEEVKRKAPVEALNLARMKDIVDLGGKVIIGVIALCYVLGLLVVNLHLSRYGIYSLSLFRINYVIAGVWVLMPIMVVLLLGGSTYLLIKTVPHVKDSAPKVWEFGPRNQGPKGKASSRRFMTIYTLILVGLLFLISVMGVVTMIRTLIKDFGQLSKILPLIGLISSSILVFFILATKASASGRPVIVSFGFFVVSILLLMHAMVFSRTFFPNIPSYLGGGSTKTVQILLKLEEKDRQFFQSSGLEFGDNSNETKDLQLLFANDNEYIFLVNSSRFPEAEGSTLSIHKDLIQGILYEGLKPNLTDRLFDPK
ncbi:MAG: hypothetical protein AABO41_11790 [Acidobacteriota bacterium]